MDPAGRNHHFFPLTGLQIGDMQSYLSKLTLFMAFESYKFLLLVDNQPWLIDREARSAHLWQLMVTKSRLSPFANTRAKPRTKHSGRLDLKNESNSKSKKSKNMHKWFSVINDIVYHKKVVFPVKKLKDSLFFNSDIHHTIYGLIVFEISWNQVGGINYLNELQTDTSVALELKLVKRWEFDSMNQASSCICSWFSGTSYERHLLEEYLESASATRDVFYDAHEGLSATDTSHACEEAADDFEELVREPFYGSSNSFCSPLFEHGTSSFHTPPNSGSYKRRKIMKSTSIGNELDGFSSEVYSEIISSTSYSVVSGSSNSSDNETTTISFEAAHYRDTLVLFRFNDPDLPFWLKKIIVSDRRLLTLLEYGLPSWVIFLQSYPVFCRIYRPWMCLLARLLYVLVSLITVLIGFYDLYKNVPVLKATASRLFGPFFEWVESWEMISRIKYLGTMLFLQNFQKAVAWSLMITCAIKSFISVLTKPMAGPVSELVEFLLPCWNICLEIVATLSSVIFSLVGSTCDSVLNFVQIILWPLWSIVSIAWDIVTSVLSPIFWMLGKILYFPIHLVVVSADFMVVIYSYVYYFLRETWSSVSSLLQLASATKAPIKAYEVSIWQSLWNDLLSKVFRAVRGILYGFIAFFAACNRHRLSIYNYLREFLHFSPASYPINSINLEEPKPQSSMKQVKSHRK